MESLKYQASFALVNYVKVYAGLVSWNYYEGMEPDPMALPHIVAEVTGITEAFPDAMPKRVAITLHIVSAIDIDDDADNVHGESSDRGVSWAAHVDAVAAVEAELRNLAQLKAFVNSDNVVNRPVSNFYLYDIQEDGQSTDYPGEDRVFHSTINLTLICEGQDN